MRHTYETLKAAEAARKAKLPGMVIYKGRRHEVLDAATSCGGTPLWKLRSRFERTSSFEAARADCVELFWSRGLERWVTVPANDGE